MILPRARTLLLSAVTAALVAMVGVTIQRELMPRVGSSPVASGKIGPEQSALSAEEETYAAALWPIHSEVVEVSAVDMSLAGMAYVIEHHDPHRLQARVLRLRDRVKSAADMVQIAADGNVDHLINAQSMSQRAAEELLKVGDVLWPGEYKPN